MASLLSSLARRSALHVVRRYCNVNIAEAEASAAKRAMQASKSGDQRPAPKFDEDRPEFLGAKLSYTNTLQYLRPELAQTLPVYRIMNREGQIVGQDPETGKTIDVEATLGITREVATKWYSTMIQLNVLDQIMYESQRQGRVSFYMTNYGEEGVQIGSAAALHQDDMIYAQYREAGVIMYRGMTIAEMMDQCYANSSEPARGRQMPVHYGSRKLNFVTISSPLATQMPQAPGSAYALKRAGKPNIVICYFGEGAASEGDAHAAFNFAATLDAPVLFVCRNNGYAISTPCTEQYRGDGIASRGSGYGMATIRVDGNDSFAVYHATRTARQLALTESRPVLLEMMTYRVGHHSTSDDSSMYRSVDEISAWASHDNPIKRLRLFLQSRSWWSDEEEKKLRQECRKRVLDSVLVAEKKPKPSPHYLFTDVYDQLTPRLRKQFASMKEHVKKHPEHYPIKHFDPIPDE